MRLFAFRVSSGLAKQRNVLKRTRIWKVSAPCPKRTRTEIGRLIVCSCVARNRDATNSIPAKTTAHNPKKQTSLSQNELRFSGCGAAGGGAESSMLAYVPIQFVIVRSGAGLKAAGKFLASV